MFGDFITRYLWFLLVGWWLTFITMILGIICCMTYVAWPLGIRLLGKMGWTFALITIPKLDTGKNMVRARPYSLFSSGGYTYEQVGPLQFYSFKARYFSLFINLFVNLIVYYGLIFFALIIFKRMVHHIAYMGYEATYPFMTKPEHKDYRVRLKSSRRASLSEKLFDFSMES